MTFRALLREPLVHFLGLGLLLFALYALVAPPATSGAHITVSRAVVEDLKSQYRKLWGRPPGQAELKALIDSRVTEEILYREGLAMGLDKDDAVIKRRIRQKYDLIAEEEDSVAPTDADLEAYLKANPDKFRQPPILGFTQLLLPASGSAAEVARIRAALERGGDPQRLGQSTLLPARIEGQPLDLVARDFGDRFAAGLVALPEGRWAGPVPSAYGLHLVKIERRVPAEVPPLAAVRRDVQREWENDRRLKAREARLAELRKRYTVEIEGAQ